LEIKCLNNIEQKSNLKKLKKMDNLSNDQNKKKLEKKPTKSPKKIRIEDPSELAQHMTEDQMSKFLDLLIESSGLKKKSEEKGF